MTAKSTTVARKRRSLPGRILRFFLLVLAGLLSLAVLAVAAVFIWLATPHADKVLGGLLVRTLAQQGLILEYGRFSARPLFSLTLEDVVLADSLGPALYLDAAHVRLAAGDLFKESVRVTAFHLEKPVLLRLPEPAVAEKEEEPADNGPGFSLALPVSIHVDSLTINRGGIAPALLQLPGEALLTFDVEGSAAVVEGELTGGLSLNLSLPSESMGFLAAEETGSGEADGSDGQDIRLDLRLDSFRLAAPEPGKAQAEGRLHSRLRWKGLDEELAVDAAVSLQGKEMELSRLVARGLGLAVEAAATLDADTAAFGADITLEAGENARWQKLAVDLAGMEPELVAALGNPLSLEARAAGNGAGAYSLDIGRLQAGQISGSGRADIDLSGAHGLLDTDLDLTVAELEPFLEGRVTGPLRVRVVFKGGPEASVGGLTLSSPGLITPAGEITGLQAGVSGEVSVPTQGAVKGNGELSVSSESAPGGAASLSGRWSLDLPAAGSGLSGAASLTGFNVSGFGLEASGDLRAILGALLLQGEARPPGTPPSPQDFLGADFSAANLWPDGLALNGSFTARVRDWRPLSAFIGPGLDIQGAQADISLSHDGAAQAVDLDLSLSSLAMPEAGDLRLADVNARLQTAFSPGFPDLVLDMKTGPGAAGGVDWAAIAAGVDGRGRAGTFNLLVSGRDKGKALLAAEGGYDLSAMSFNLAAFKAEDPRMDVGATLRKPVAISLRNGLSVSGLALDFLSQGKPAGQADATVSLAGGRMRADAVVTGLPLSLVNRLGGTSLPDGRVEARLNAAMSGGRPEGGLEVDLHLDRKTTQAGTNAALEGTPEKIPEKAPADVSLTAALDRSEGRLALVGGVSFALINNSQGGPDHQDGQAKAQPVTFRLPMRVEPSGLPVPDMNAPLRAAVQWTGNIGPLWSLLPMPDRELSGLASVDLTVTGSLNSPQVDGAVYLAGGRLNDRSLGVLLTDIILEGRAENLETFNLALSATDGRSGTLQLEADLKTAPEIRLDGRGHIKSLAPLHRDDVDMTLSGIINVSGTLPAITVGADILVERGDVTLLSSLGGGSVPTLEIAEADAPVEEGQPGPVLDVKVTIPRRFHIRGRGLDSEWQGQLAVKGPVDEPSLTGSLQPVRGYFELLARPFQFGRGEISFFGGSRINPGINLELTYQGSTLTASIRATGNLEKPRITLDSTPPLPQDEILAQVLFGRNVSQLSRFEALQLANGLRELANIGSGGMGILANMRRATGLDVLRLGSTADDQQNRQASNLTGAANVPGQVQSGTQAEDSATLEAGRYINDSIYIGVEQGATQESTSVRVEIELLPNMTLQGRSGTASSSAGLGWKRDY